jgi:hypothetical protein
MPTVTKNERVFETVETTSLDVGGAPVSSGHVVQNATTPLTARANLNFTGAGVVASDNAGTGATDVTIAGGGGAALTAITVTYTGTPVYPFKCNVIQPEGVQINSTLYTASGKWVLTFGDYLNDPPFYLDGYTTLSFPDLVGVRNDFYFGFSASDTIEEFVSDSLVVIGGNYQVSSNAALTTNSQAALVVIGGNYYVYDNPALETNSQDALTTIGGNYEVYDNAALVSLTLPAIESMGGAISMIVNVGTMALLTTFTLGSGLLLVGGNVTINQPPLAEASVNNTLVRLAALDGTGGTTLYTGFIVDVSGNCAPPSATGLAARLTLIAASNTVSVNGNFAITAAAAAPTNTFTIAGDKTTIFVAGTTFVVAGSAANDGTYTVSSSAFGAATVISVAESVTGNDGGGTIGKITG